MNRLTRAGFATALVGLAVVSQPGVVHADAAGPTDWRTTIVSVTPATDIVRVSIEGGDAFMRAVVQPGHELVVLGYSGEPYLKIDGEGDVYENQRSAATFVNSRRDGNAAVPSTVDPDAEPDWKRVGSGGAWAWHDHRAHWMGKARPEGMVPGDALPEQTVPLLVDGSAVDVTVVSHLVAGPNLWWTTLIMFVTVTAFVGARWSRFAAPGLAFVVAASALVAGIAQFASLPSETGPSPTWWLLPGIATACAAASLALTRVTKPLVLTRVGLTLITGAQLFVWAWRRRPGLSRGVLPTDLPFALDRAITTAAAVGGATVLVIAAWSLWRIATQPAAPSAASSAA